jgi:molybdate-binding protein/DNA-binding XRE family transcriptional regulator
VENRLAGLRKKRGLGASDLARRIGVSRQTIYAIEAGTYVPNTEVALRLARELDVTVEELFSLRKKESTSARTLTADVLSSSPEASGRPVRICQVGTKWVSVPATASPYYLPEADGIIQDVGSKAGRARLSVVSAEDSARNRLVLAGCDPATSLLTRMIERTGGVEVVSAAASSRLALGWLKEGKVHIAGSHLEDPKSGDFNLPLVRKEFPEADFRVITFARWEEGLVVAPGNPKSIRAIDDLSRKNIRFVNREPGSGSRALLDKLLAKDGIEAVDIRGYDRVAWGHLAAAYTVMAGDADACLATHSAAKAFGLDFVPLREERYDLVMRRSVLELPAAKVFLDVLQRAELRRKLEVFAGYDTSETGAVLA